MCSRCRHSAGTVQMFVSGNRAEVVRDSFTSRFSACVSAASIEHVHHAIVTGNAHALYSIDLEYAPFFCPECNLCYCGAHCWRRDVFDEDGFHDCIRGTCPEGHERMLED